MFIEPKYAIQNLVQWYNIFYKRDYQIATNTLDDDSKYDLDELHLLLLPSLVLHLICFATDILVQ